MVERQEGPSEGPVWYLQQDVQVALLWNQLNAVCSQLAQTNQQLCLQQNVILGLQQQRHADQKLISKLVDRLLEPECDTESTHTGSPRSDSEESLDAEWILVHDAWEETKPTEAAAPVAAEILHCAATTRSQADSPEKGQHPVAPSSAAALWLGLPICHRSDSCDVPESSPPAAECQEAPSEEPEPPKQSLGGRADAACQTDGEDGSVCGLLKDATATLCSHSPTTLTDIEVGGGECTPSDLHVANLLPYLGVQDLLSWRLVCRRTRSPEALTAHVAEMGSMDTPDAILFFAEQLHQFCVNPHVSFEAAFGSDAEQHKLCECRLWCMALASKTLTHFSESYVRRTVGKNLQSLLRHCWSADTSVAAAAHDIVHNHASDALPFVQQAIAESMLALMEDLVTSNMRANLKQIGPCAHTLEKILRSLSKPQCQKWVSLTVKLLMDPHVTDKERLVWQLKMLWLVDDDPKRTYAEAEQQLLTVAVCDIGAFKNDLYMQFFNICDEDADGRINYEDFETYCAVHGESIVNQTLKILEVMFDGVIEETGIIITATDVRNTKPHIDWQASHLPPPQKAGKQYRQRWYPVPVARRNIIPVPPAAGWLARRGKAFHLSSLPSLSPGSKTKWTQSVCGSAAGVRLETERRMVSGFTIGPRFVRLFGSSVVAMGVLVHLEPAFLAVPLHVTPGFLRIDPLQVQGILLGSLLRDHKLDDSFHLLEHGLEQDDTQRIDDFEGLGTIPKVQVKPSVRLQIRDLHLVAEQEARPPDEHGLPVLLQLFQPCLHNSSRGVRECSFELFERLVVRGLSALGVCPLRLVATRPRTGNAYKLLRKLATRAGRTKLGRFIAEGDTFLRPSLQFWSACGVSCYDAVPVLPVVLLMADTGHPDVAPGFAVLSNALFDQLSTQEKSQGVLCVFGLPRPSTVQALGESVVILDGVEDPNNLGVILRTMEAFGSKTLVLTKGQDTIGHCCTFNGEAPEGSSAYQRALRITTGAGGLSAAKRLQDNGHSVTLLEGGRTWTSKATGFAVDLGASWIHGAGPNNPLTPFVTEFGIATRESADEQRCRYDKDGYKYNNQNLLAFESYCWGPESAGYGDIDTTGTMEAALRSYDPAFFNTVEGEMCLAGWDFNQGSTIDLVSQANEAISEVT
ncbi:PAO3, partial [Symbiodinium sp. KB8]